MKRALETFRTDAIEISSTRHRSIDPAIVARLAESIRKIGLRTPISVRIVDNYVAASGETCDGQPLLVTGAHRLEAVRSLGIEKIECWIWSEDDETQARLWEISENLHRAELTALERDQHLAEWVRLTEQADQSRQSDANESKRADKRGHRKQSGTRKAARELGVTEPDARRALKVASLTDDAKDAAVETGLDDNRSALLKAAEQPPENQATAIRDIAAGKALAKKNQKMSPPIHQPPAPLKDLIDAASDVSAAGDPHHQVNLLIYAWEAAGEDARVKFLKWIPSEYLGAIAA